jgi:hypothetical protein
MKTDNNINPKFQLVYTDKFKNKWYGYVDPLEIDAVRGIAAHEADRYVAMMISRDELALAFDAQVKAVKDGDWLKVGSICYDLQFRNKMLCEANSLLDLAGVYYVLQDEDSEMYLEAFKKKKQQIWQDDPACRSFFLRMGVSLTKKLENISPKDLLTSLEKTQEVADRIYRHIQKPSDR